MAWVAAPSPLPVMVSIIAGLCSWAAYAVLLRPFFFSPLRHLPEPKKGNSFLHGQQAAIAKQPTG